MHSRVNFLPIISLLLIVSCGGGGGGGGSSEVPASSGGGSTPAPITGSTQAIALTFSTSSSDVELNGSVTLTWAGTNATSCDASGAWGGSNKAASGTETVNLPNIGTQTFSVVCKNAANSVTASTSVEVYQIIGGTVLDGYIRGAEVFVDRNNNLTLDSNESSVTTDNSGAFSNLRMYDGQLVAKNGTDLDTSFLFNNFTLKTKPTTDSLDYIISPVTSVGASLSNPADVNKIFGISSDIDVYSVDPIPLINDAKYATLYSIGNRLTVLAMGVQQFEAANKDLPSYFNVIATEAQTSYDASTVSVQMDDPDFVRSVLNTALGTSTADDFKSNLSTMLSNSLYLLQVKDNSAATTGIQNFAFTTLQDDITKLKNCSSASSCAVMNNYTNDVFGYVAGDQNLALSDVTIPIQAFADVLEVNEDTELSFSQATLLVNDNYLKGTGNTFVFTDAANGSFLSADAGSFRYLPNQDFNGADTFTYTIGQAGEESTGTVTINVAPVNDNPTVIARSFSNTGGGTAVFDNVGANDIDGDALSYTIGGTDAQYISVAGNGDLSFTNAVSYASPSDGNGDNIYDFTVAVSDGGTSVTQSFQVEVKPGGSAPIFSGTASSPSFYPDSSITIQINASDPDGDAMSLSISNPIGFSITSNANGFEITNSSGLAAGTYNVQGVITDNNFNTSFSFEINVLNSPSEPPRLFLNGSDVSKDSPGRQIFLWEGNRGVNWGSWDEANNRPMVNWTPPSSTPYLEFDNVNFSIEIIDPIEFTLEMSDIGVGGASEAFYSGWSDEKTNKLIQFKNVSSNCVTTVNSNSADKISYQFAPNSSNCTLTFNLSYNRSRSFSAITKAGSFSAQGTGTFHNRMGLVEPDYQFDVGTNGESEGPYQYQFSIIATNANQTANYNFNVDVSNLNEAPYLHSDNGVNLVDEYIYKDTSTDNPYGSTIEYMPTLRIKATTGSRLFTFYISDDSNSIGVTFVSKNNDHFIPENTKCNRVTSNQRKMVCTAVVPEDVYNNAVGETFQTVLLLDDRGANPSFESYHLVYVTVTDD